MANYGTHFSTRQTPQSEAIPGKPMLPNSAGGFSFAISDWDRLDRFLVLGSEGGSYYASERKLTIENAQAVLRCAKEDGKRTVARIVEISDSGRAPKNDPAIFALAICAGQKIPEALEALPKVARIGTHLFSFVEAVEKFRGHGTTLNRALRDWYRRKNAKDLAFQLVKYQSRNGWSHRDILRLCKVRPPYGERQAEFVAYGNPHDFQHLYYWVAKGWDSVGDEPHPREALQLIWAFEKVKRSTDKEEIVKLIRDYNMPRECIPTQFLTEASVWEALLEHMPMTAMIRNLATMTRVGLLSPMSAAVGKVLKELTDGDRIKKSRLHPVAILMALKTYAQGRGEKSDKTWQPVPQIIDALDGAFYRAFGNVEPTGKRWMLGIDVSHSMSAACAGTPLTCCEGATAMALVTAHVESQYMICAFNSGLQQLPISAKSRLDDALRHTRNINGGGTDCSLPMIAAEQNKIPIDIFVTVTDNETWAGSIHPCQALNRYREKMGIAAKMAVIGMVSNGFSISDPEDAGTIDFVGFDSSVPSMLSDFAKG